MATSTATIRLTTTLFAVCAKENDQLGVFSFKSLYDAYRHCRKGKRNTINAMHFEADLIGNLTGLQNQLLQGSYQPSRSVCFYTKKPKLREIVAADFSDRVVHHYLVPRLEAILEPQFIYDNYACRRNKGTHAAVDRLQKFMRAVQQADASGGWYSQIDIRSFFMSIDHSILLSILKRKVTDPHLFKLAQTIIQHNPVQDCHIKDQQALAKKIPAHKSLFHVPAGKGLPIGNLSSQFFANVYLNELDQFIKHQLKCRYYIRYVDDFIILHPDRHYLQWANQRIVDFCQTELKLEFKQQAILKPCQQGIDFLGYVTRPNYRLVRRRVVGNLRSKLHEFERKMLVMGKTNGRFFQHAQLAPLSVFQLQQTFAAYLGHFKHANTHRLCASLFQNYPLLAVIFELDAQRLSLTSRLQPSVVPSTFREQVQTLGAKHPKSMMLVQVGRFCELYDRSAHLAAQHLGLELRPSKRGFAWQVGFPLRQLAQIKRRLRQRGLAYVVVAEQDCLSSKLKRRQITEHFILLPNKSYSF